MPGVVERLFIPVEEEGVHRRLERLLRRSIKKQAKLEGLRLAIATMDLTTLEGADTPERVRRLCLKALEIPEEIEGLTLPYPAAVCVYPSLVGVARKILEGAPVRVASVATGFPAGQTSLQVKLEETRIAVEEGAHEVDMVINRGAFLRGEYSLVMDEIRAVKEICGDEVHLKVILEVQELDTPDNVRLATLLAMEAGADFVKTSTGKLPDGGRPDYVLVMAEAVRDYYLATGRRVGIKPAGGIRTARHALQLLVIMKETLGSAWLTPELFRIGASTLINDILMQIRKELTGGYQSPEYFSLP